MGRLEILVALSLIFSFQVNAEDRCKDDSFCRAYCLSTNPDTVRARCGMDLASCICITPYNQAVKVRFIDERPPVPPSPSTTPRPVAPDHGAGVHYVNSQSLPQEHHNNGNNYNGYNGNSISGNGNQYQPHAQTQQEQLAPVLLECDASESSTRMCHLFCTMEIRAWYGLCNTTSKACACFGIPPSAIQKDPIAAIFHSTAPITTPPPTTPRPTPPHIFQQQQQYPHPHQNFQQQQWQPIPPSSYQQQTSYNNYPYQASPAVLSPVPQNNQLVEQGPVRSAASMFGSNGQPISPNILTPTSPASEMTPAASAVSSNSGDAVESVTSEISGADVNTESEPVTTIRAPSSRKRRSPSLNDTPLLREKFNPLGKDLSMSGTCTKYKCGIACKRNNYFAPDCTPKCIDGECWCECYPKD